MASTKWVVGLEVLGRAFIGHYNTAISVHVDESGAPVRAVREMPVKSVITSAAPRSAPSGRRSPGTPGPPTGRSPG